MKDGKKEKRRLMRNRKQKGKKKLWQEMEKWKNKVEMEVKSGGRYKANHFFPRGPTHGRSGPGNTGSLYETRIVEPRVSPQNSGILNARSTSATWVQRRRRSDRTEYRSKVVVSGGGSGKRRLNRIS